MQRSPRSGTAGCARRRYPRTCFALEFRSRVPDRHGCVLAKKWQRAWGAFARRFNHVRAACGRFEERDKILFPLVRGRGAHLGSAQGLVHLRRIRARGGICAFGQLRRSIVCYNRAYERGSHARHAHRTCFRTAAAGDGRTACESNTRRTAYDARRPSASCLQAE